MKKSDLENGMIIEWNDNFNELGVIIGDSIRYKNGYDELSILDENLRYKKDKKDYISAIYKVKEKCCSLLNIFKKENLELIWKRPREIDWSKVPKWTKVQVKFPGEIEWENYLFTDYLPNNVFKFHVAGFKDDEFTGYEATRHQVEYCRIHESVEIKEEWYKEC
ncbi:Uncharacterised protein [Clostridium perfringens]|uniref:Uncharacterized protein n=1 Tax=Clostridium perfringens TaxID=1502 RepID=A0A2X3KD74_CLOPF|nr:hypothetical protein [Clostridium perfringens]SQC85430.1 Uncharacterised protein [Clostridium perfringens]